MELNLEIAPGALSKFDPRPNGDAIIRLGQWLLEYRTRYDLNQRQASRLLGLGFRRIQTYEATARWSEANKQKVASAPGVFDFTETTRLARQSWPSQRSLSAAIDRVLNSEPARKRYARRERSSMTTADRQQIVDMLRERYGTRVVIDGHTVAFVYAGNDAVLSMLTDRLLGGV